MSEPRRHMTPDQMEAVDAGLDAMDVWRAEQAAKRAVNGRLSSPSPSPSPARPGPGTAGLVVERWQSFRDNSEADEVEYVVDGVVPAGGTGFVSGGPKNGKTWQALHMAVAIATGKRYAGRYSTRRRDVVYLALEGARANIRARVGCLARGLGVDPEGDALDQLHVIYKPRRIDLHEAASAAEVVRAVSGVAPGVLFVDVLRRAARIRESGEGVADFAEMLENLEPLTSAGWTVILLHHFKKWSENAGGDTGDRMSGSGSLFGSADFAVFIVKANRESRTYSLEFVSRDGPQLPDLTVRIQGEGAGPHGGLTYHDTATVVSESDEDAPARRVDSIDNAILSWVGEHPGMAKRRVLDGVGGSRNDADTRLDALVVTGRIVVQPGKNNARLHYLPEALPTPLVTLSNACPAGGVTALPTPVGGNATTTSVTNPAGTLDDTEDGGW